MSEEPDPLERACKVHEALDGWTTKVDTKGSIVLALETALLAGLLNLTGPHGALADLTGRAVTLFRVGVGLLTTAVVLSGAAVIPQLRRWASRREWQSNTIYFGHLRHWEPDDLAEQLGASSAASTLNELAQQHVRMARIAWRKHSYLQLSMLLVPLATLLLWLSSTWD